MSFASDTRSLAVFHTSCATKGAGIMNSAVSSAHCHGSTENAIIAYMSTSRGHTKRVTRYLKEFLKARSRNLVNRNSHKRNIGLASSYTGSV